ncbi:hypothetical protein [Vibrio sp. THAF190c]|uniref:hypothetical protein n=1 Tax=Vibrio sp. THAF190c TaxID=2587865 RepID=UPI00126800F3|nr:hypothetical protein [Vibrio sp. THAF190c]QFT13562.1 hypothetical protein FIV04_26765 [Vibrio sp. THAF190c]
MKKLILLSLMTISMGVNADVVDNAPNNVFIYNPSLNQLKKQDGSVISSSDSQSMVTSPHQFKPSSNLYWGVAHTLNKPITAVRMSKSNSNDSFVMKVKIDKVSNRINYGKYYNSGSSFHTTLQVISSHNSNTGHCRYHGTYFSSAGRTGGEQTHYIDPGWDENAPSCRGRGRGRKYSGNLFDSSSTTNTVDNKLHYYINLETPNGTPEPGTYTGTNSLNWSAFYHRSSGVPARQYNTVNFNYVVIVEPEYHRVEAPSEVKFSESLDPNHRKTSFYADVYGIFSEQMKVTATSANSSGTGYEAQWNENVR